MSAWHDAVRNARTARGLSQMQLARAIGVSQAIIGKIEAGQVTTSRALGPIVEHLGIDRSEIPESAFGQEIAVKPVNAQVPVKISRIDETLWPPTYRDDLNILLYGAAEDEHGILINRSAFSKEPRHPRLQLAYRSYALYYSGTSMSPIFEPGDILIVNPDLPAIPGNVCLFVDEDRAPYAILGRYVEADSTHHHVRADAQGDVVKLSKAQYAAVHRIVGTWLR